MWLTGRSQRRRLAPHTGRQKKNKGRKKEREKKKSKYYRPIISHSGRKVHRQNLHPALSPALPLSFFFPLRSRLSGYATNAQPLFSHTKSTAWRWWRQQQTKNGPVITQRALMWSAKMKSLLNSTPTFPLYFFQCVLSPSQAHLVPK